MTEIESESDSYQSEDSKQQELAIYYPVSISSSSVSADIEVLADQLDPNAKDISGKLLDTVVKAESGEMVEHSELISMTPMKYAQIVYSDSFDEQTPPSKRVSLHQVMNDTIFD